MMGTASQPYNTRREPLDTSAGRDTAPCSGGPLRQGRLYAASMTGPPPVQVASSRPHSRSMTSATGDAFSPRQHHPSYRDAALVASQYGLSAYAPSAAAAASSVRLPAAANAATRGSVAGGGSASSQGGRPPAPPRHSQHSAPSPYHMQYVDAERLPSRCGPPPSRGAQPGSRPGAAPAPAPAGLPQGRSQLHSRGGARPPSGAGAFSARAQQHRLSETAESQPLAHLEGWRGTHADHVLHTSPSSQDAEEFISAGPGILPMTLASGPSLLNGPASSRGVSLSAAWGAGAPSAYELDGRPGTRGGGPQYDMEGRPTTRGGARPPSRVQLGLSGQPKPPAHVPPLGGAGWASMFAPANGLASGLGGSGGGQDISPSSTMSSSGAGGGGGGYRSSGDGYEPSSSLRRQPLPLPLAMSGPSSGPLSTGSISSINGGSAAAGGAASFSPPLGTSVAGVLSSLGPAQPGGQLPAYHPASYQAAPAQAPGAAASGGGASAAGGHNARLAWKLSSIAEVPSALQSPKDSMGRLGSAGASRKPSRERDRQREGHWGWEREREALGSSMLSSIPDSVDGASLDGLSDEGLALLNDLVSVSNLDQDPGSSRGAGRSGRSRRRSSSRASSERGSGSGGAGAEGGSRSERHAPAAIAEPAGRS